MAVGRTGGGFMPPPGHTIPTSPHPDETNVLPLNFPYRGNEQHGVPANPVWVPGDTTGEEDEVGKIPDYDELPDPVVPLAVTIVDKALHERRLWRSAVMVADANPRILLGRNPARTRCLIRNNDAANTVTIGDSNALSVNNGWLLPIAATIELFTEEEIYAIATDPTKTVLVHVMQEFAAES